MNQLFGPQWLVDATSLLSQALHRCNASGNELVSIAATAGRGKTTLARHALSSAQLTKPIVVFDADHIRQRNSRESESWCLFNPADLPGLAERVVAEGARSPSRTVVVVLPSLAHVVGVLQLTRGSAGAGPSLAHVVYLDDMQLMTVDLATARERPTPHISAVWGAS